MVLLERSWKDENSAVYSIIKSDKVMVFQRFRQFSKTHGWAFIWGAAIEQENMVHDNMTD